MTTDELAHNLVQKTGAGKEASHTIRRTLAGTGLNARAVSSQGGLVPGGGDECTGGEAAARQGCDVARALSGACRAPGYLLFKNFTR